MALTLPQVIMINAGARVNSARHKERSKTKERAAKRATDDPIAMNGKRLSELTTDEMAAYMMPG